MKLIVPKKLSKYLWSESTTINEYVSNGTFKIHPLFIKLYKQIKRKSNNNNNEIILQYYEQLYIFDKYPHEMYTKLCIIIGAIPYMKNRKQVAFFINQSFWDYFFTIKPRNDNTIRLDIFINGLLDYIKTGEIYTQDVSDCFFQYIMFHIIDIHPLSLDVDIMDIVWNVVDSCLKNVTYSGWKEFSIKLECDIITQLSADPKLSVKGRLIFNLFLKLASVCTLSLYRYAPEMHMDLSEILLKVSLYCKFDSNEFFMMTNSFTNSLLPLYCHDNDDTYYNLMIHTEKYFEQYPTESRFKIHAMIKIIKKLRKKILHTKSHMNFIYIGYMVYFSSVFNPMTVDCVQTLKDINYAYKYNIKYDSESLKCSNHPPQYTQPYWLDVIVEIMLALLVNSGKWIKKLCLIFFNQLAYNHIVKSTWKIIFECIVKPDTLLISQPTKNDGMIKNIDSEQNTNSTLSIANSSNMAIDSTINNHHLYSCDIILDHATPEQLMELEKLSNSIKNSDPIKNSTKTSTIVLHRAFQLRVLNLLSMPSKLGLNDLQIICYSYDLIDFTVNFKVNPKIPNDTNLFEKLLSTINLMLSIKTVSIDPVYMDKELHRKIKKLIKIIDRNFLIYLYKLHKHKLFPQLLIKWLSHVHCFIVKNLSYSKKSFKKFNTISENIYTKILEDFLTKRNPILKVSVVVDIFMKNNLILETHMKLIDQILDHMCRCLLRPPQLVNATYMLLVALRNLTKYDNILWDKSCLIQKWNMVMKKLDTLPKNKKIIKNKLGCNHIIKKLSFTTTINNS